MKKLDEYVKVFEETLEVIYKKCLSEIYTHRVKYNNLTFHTFGNNYLLIEYRYCRYHLQYNLNDNRFNNYLILNNKTNLKTMEKLYINLRRTLKKSDEDIQILLQEVLINLI